MSGADGRRRGRRDNGLDAAFYVPLADVDPRIGEHLLDVLWAAGVPAYLEPPTEPTGDAQTDAVPTSTLRRPLPPVDRLWVDRDRRADARNIVESEAPRVPEQVAQQSVPESVELDQQTEQEWAAIVAAYETEPADPVPPWPAAEDLDVREIRTRPREEPVVEPVREHVDPVQEHFEADEDEGHYEPPPPPPFPRPSGWTVLALAILALGVILIFAPDLLEAGDSGGFLFGVICVLGSAGIFIWRLHERHPDDPDDGAVV